MTDTVEFAITLHRPWAGAVCYLHEDFVKRVENRSWKPPKSIIGKRIAIHAGKQWDEIGWQKIQRIADDNGRPFIDGGPNRLSSDFFFRDTGIIATARVYGCINENEDLVMGQFPPESRCKPPGPLTGQVMESWIQEHVFDWFSGPYGWIIGDVKALLLPIECNGKQKLWRLPPDVAQALTSVAG